MVRNLLEARGGLHNRVTRKIRLLPFTLGETGAFLASRRVELTPYQLLELYMALGGVAHYLKLVEPGLSSAQSIDQLCFQKHGELRNEFPKLYASLFDDSEEHLRIVKVLAKSPRGLTRNDLLVAAKMPSGGSATQRLDELAESGFIETRVPFGRAEKDAVIRLADEFSLFHCTWIAPLGSKSSGKDHWMRLRQSPKWRAWSGYAFEGICMKHVGAIKAAMGIAGVHSSEAPWQHFPKKGEEGAQIDLLIDRADDTISLCEMKFCEGEFAIDKRFAGELRRKRDVFRRITKTRKNLHFTMVTTFGVSDNAYRKELVANSVVAKDLFP
jgi:hypothetical protein